MTARRDDVRFIERQEAAQMKYHFKTNAVVRVTELQPPRVNGRPLDLGTHGFTLLLLLAERAKESQGDFVPTDDIVLALEKGKRVLGDLRMSWDAPTKNAVHSAVSEVRLALKKNKLNNDLIESVKGKGYRLSTPAMNILIDVPGADKLARLSMRPFDDRNGDGPPNFRHPFSSP